MSTQVIWLATQNPEVQEVRVKLLSFVIHGWRAEDASREMSYSDAWGSQQLLKIRRGLGYSSTFQLFYALAKRGFEPIPLIELLEDVAA